MTQSFATVLRTKYRNFTTADAATRFKMLMRALWRYGALLPVGLLAFGVLRALRPLVKVRIGKLFYERVGNLGPGAELYLRRLSRGKDANRERHIFVTAEPANRQLLMMIKRQVPVLKGRPFLEMHNVVKSFTKDSDLWIELPWTESWSGYDEFNNVAPQLAFTEGEERRGKQVLASMGIEPGTPFVCFHARDHAYLDTIHNWRSREEWSYHDFRDCDIRNYLPAMEYLTSLGLFAVRMGYVVKSVLPTHREQIIDYATCYRSDFGDIYLPAKCKFFIGSTAGISCIPWIFNVPVAFTNWIPLGIAPLGKRDLFIPKKLWSREKKRFLTFREILACGMDRWMHTHLFTQAGIEVVENTADEILALVREMNARMDGTWVPRDDDDELQERYRALFPPDHPITGYPSRVGAEFLRQHRELLE